MLRVSNSSLETTPFSTFKFHKITNKSPNFCKFPKPSSSFKNSSNRTIITLHSRCTRLSNPKNDVVEAEDDVELETTFPYVQTLSKFPKAKLLDKLVMIRFDAVVLIEKQNRTAVHTVKYLHEAGAKLILVSDWRRIDFNAEIVVAVLESILELKVVYVKCVSSSKPVVIEMLANVDVILLENLSEFKEEAANCSNFSKLLSSNVDVFVNDAFSVSHKILASAVGVTQFCSACLAGFHFEECVLQIKNVVKTDKRPFFAIIGGGNIRDKDAALRFLASRCDGMIFVGMMAFQIMHALGYPVSSNLIEPGGREAALDIIQLAHKRSIPVTFPKDFWCANGQFPKCMEVFTSNSLMAGEILMSRNVEREIRIVIYCHFC